ncbi:MAG: hypothetical protein A3B99_05310 [Candidatus Yanofskybacteria bacterium RIFCSPHIGHO2_02_FULL_44_12b]|uniref:Band 7 domain-containing protein n=2 Tax=Candidatus Yanofskyibacteriota TaxID=1752733 RepID=A0A1F8GKD7_9BACT|nr:MAG: hypothetical protein UW79_C0033G0002 [Candidatus Yanofskybacteria bacterium GW2011_GWA2_44_9]OGN04898.1 MAG: hypothetical protein A2659_04630 [Candidatus Yanofskybacteria bacterium RIFCSPHIGHO2_01_FULL_44_24]OGN14082.1 MAG: hypothetical protein A3B99_05310 [Candidatus Yanofskybacteria bacterium RIFCSPHIGHO2_02_FULL_44_12b]OGN25178.1 MAG: hypothetical protein A2925_03000 [Candidatus Yanofskybacteria bacterium RIFCSPLOWO2_01_FULL_44_22]
MERNWTARIVAGVLGGLVVLSVVVWLVGSSNPHTPAGYVGYVTRGAVFGKAQFVKLQTGPTSTGRGWLLDVTNVSVTPYTYTEDFMKEDSVLSKDNLKLSFRVHTVFKMRPDRVQDFMDNFSYLGNGQGDPEHPDEIVRVAYGNFIKEPLRTFSRDEVQKHNGLEVKDNITSIGQAIEKRIRAITDKTPFELSSVVVGNIQYPQEVSDAVANKLATTQLLERKTTEIEIEKKDKEKRVIQAQGIAQAMAIIQQQLTGQYLQHEAIEAQKLMVNSPNNTVVYIPVGPMGVPIVGTMDVTKPGAPVVKK